MLVLLLVPYVLVTILGLLLGATITDAHAAGVISLACSPSLLVGPALIARLGPGKREAAASLVAGSLALAAITVGLGAVPSLAPAATLGMTMGWAFIGGAAVASVLQPLRDMLLWPIARIGDLSAFVLLAILAVRAGPRLDPFSFVLALSLFGIGAGAAWLLALVARRDGVAAVTGAGTRDGLIAGSVALAAAGPVAAAVPLAYLLVTVLAGALLALRGVASSRR